MIIRNPSNNKTLLANIDYYNDLSKVNIQIESVKDIFSCLEEIDSTFKVRLIGGKFEDSSQRSKHNIEKVIEFLWNKPVDIISADLNRKDQPRCLVVDPKTFKVLEEVPNHPKQLSLRCLATALYGVGYDIFLSVLDKYRQELSEAFKQEVKNWKQKKDQTIYNTVPLAYQFDFTKVYSITIRKSHLNLIELLQGEKGRLIMQDYLTAVKKNNFPNPLSFIGTIELFLVECKRTIKDIKAQIC